MIRSGVNNGNQLQIRCDLSVLLGIYMIWWNGSRKVFYKRIWWDILMIYPIYRLNWIRFQFSLWIDCDIKSVAFNGLYLIIWYYFMNNLNISKKCTHSLNAGKSGLIKTFQCSIVTFSLTYSAIFFISLIYLKAFKIHTYY